MTENQNKILQIITTRPVFNGDEFPSIMDIMSSYVMEQNGGNYELAEFQIAAYFEALEEQTR